MYVKCIRILRHRTLRGGQSQVMCESLNPQSLKLFMDGFTLVVFRDDAWQDHPFFSLSQQPTSTRNLRTAISTVEIHSVGGTNDRITILNSSVPFGLRGTSSERPVAPANNLRIALLVSFFVTFFKEF